MRLFFITIGIFIIGLVVGVGLGRQEYNRELKKISVKMKDKSGFERVESFDKVIDILEKKLDEKEKALNTLKSENDLLHMKVANLENQISEIFNEIIKGEQHREERMAKTNQLQNNSDRKEKKSSDELIKNINSLMENGDIVGALKLLRQLVTYGKEYYRFAYDTIRKAFQDNRKGGGFNFNRMEFIKVLNSPEFVDYYKWVIENPDVDNRSKMGALHGLIWAEGEEVKPYLFEQFKVQNDPALRSRLFSLLSDSPEYKGSFIDIAKDLSGDVNLRKRIVLTYANDNSHEVQNLYNFLKDNEKDEEIKKIVNVVSEVKAAGEQGYVVYKGGEIFKEKDIILKVGDREVNSERPFWGGPPMGGGFRGFGNAKNPDNAADDNVPVTIKRDGAITTINVTKSKLPSEFRAVEGVYIGSK